MQNDDYDEAPRFEKIKRKERSRVSKDGKEMAARWDWKKPVWNRNKHDKNI